uniref:CSON003361 protein n=1 Tax=Culicoides sonorensis TaxID=179676 RepID=A0A336MPR4_CULSO
MSNKRKVKDAGLLEHTPKQKARLTSSIKNRNNESPINEPGLETPPSTCCSTPKSQYSDDSLSQDYSPSVDVIWKSKRTPKERRRRITTPKFAQALAKEKFERNKLDFEKRRKMGSLIPERKPGELSALEKFKLGIKRLATLKDEDDSSKSPKSSKASPSFNKKKENVTKSFTFGLSDDSDDADDPQSSWNSYFRKLDTLKENQQQSPSTPNKRSIDDSWRKTKSAHELNTSTSSLSHNKSISEPQKDLFDDSINDSLLRQCTQQIENKLKEKENSEKSPPKPKSIEFGNDLDNDSFDELLSSFPLDEIVQQCTQQQTATKKNSFSRHSSMPCQSNISSYVIFDGISKNNGITSQNCGPNTAKGNFKFNGKNR